MKKIYKYQFTVDDVVRLELPEGFKVLLVECQAGQPCLWAEVDTDRPMKKYEFRFFGTGFAVPEDLSHVASFQSGPFVWHMYGPVPARAEL